MSLARNLARLFPNASGLLPNANIEAMAASKLSGQVPNINLPPGTVLQVQVCNASVNTSATTQSSQTELNTNYRVSITPQRSNSLILLEYFVPMGANGSWSANWLVDYGAIRMPSGSALNTNLSNVSSVGNANGARKTLAGSAQRSSNGYDLNDQLTWNLTALDYPGTTSALQYGFTWGGEGGGPIIVGQTSSNDGNWAYSARVVIVATEIAV